jgi:N-methylhydantoinase A/oxoprolinase/acetone carboxylase beta subunit
MKITTILAISALFVAQNSSYGQLLKDIQKKVEDKVTTPAAGLTEEEVAAGLKEALTNGVEKGVAQLSKPDGYFKDLAIKIPLPAEAKKVEDKLRQLGQGQKVDDAIESINRAAEDAAIGAKEIFVNAIKGMSLTDAMGILKGEANAATSFLEKSTRTSLFEKFKPVIKVSLDKVGATKHWTTLFTTYNKIPTVEKVDPDLEVYATNKAIDGLFVQIAKQEKEIRENPAARISDLLKKVFG